ncbi:MAG: SDR family oxidoreductase, partial [Burkholderiales bacterium]|nr:SDR family oxidoreductase [Burkholderiales bacterium]
MGILKDKKILITGLLSDRSIAYGVAKACKAQGAQLAFTYQTERFKERVANLAKDFDSELIFPCDVTNDTEINALFVELGTRWNALDGLLHSIAYSPKEGLTGDFVENV